jgi:carboxymethylenebutenolidase
MANVPGVVTDPSRIKGGVIALQSGGTQVPAYLARPHQPGSYPGIVVIQEAFGLVDHICDLARRFANIGYNAVAPALYWRRGAPKDPDVMEQVFPVMFGLPDSEAVQDLEAAADYLNGMAGATGKVGAIGFCSGGRHTLLFACSSNKVNAAIDCWGGFIQRATPDAETTAARPKAPLDMVGQLHCPLFGVFGEEDQNPPVALEAELKKRAQAAGKDVTTKIYKNAGHAFLADYRPSYREAAAQELWGDAQSFFGKHLK